jgi:hypothetical protein
VEKVEEEEKAEDQIRVFRTFSSVFRRLYDWVSRMPGLGVEDILF